MTANIRLKKPLSRSRLHEEIEGILLGNILRGELSPGEKLPTERDLARELGVNRSTVRAALSRLEGLDLVEIRHGDGAYVCDYLQSGNLAMLRAMLLMDGNINRGILLDFLEVRRIMVPEMAARAARERSTEHLEELRRAVYESPLNSMLERDIQVHHLIARASGNLLYLVLLNFFNKFVRDFGYLYFEDAENIARSQRFHHDIYSAIAARRPDQARQIMHDVLGYAEEAVQHFLQQKGEPS